MTHTYDITAKLGIEAETNFVAYVANEVQNAMSELGYSVDLEALLAPEPGTEPASAGVMLTPNTSETIDEAMENGFGWLSINEDLAGHFGRSRGSSNVTTIAVKEELSAFEVIMALSESTRDERDDVDSIQKGIYLLELMREKTDPSPADLMAYNLFIKALGWYSERILEETDDFSKGTAPQDKGGIDLWFNGTPIQLKSVVRYASQGPAKFRDKKHDHMFYQWAGDKIVVGTLEEANDVHSEAVDLLGARPDGVTKTNLKKSYGGGIMDGYGRPARVIWY